ncbi:MAG: SRPBCC domain-containing protein [Gemmatimonadaceae bacterium]|nr:SRPBCC domain-containing protein [Gemmatimonadaceae bacterium]
MIVKTKILACSVARAFDLFTNRAGEWWPSQLRHTGDEASLIVMSATGRFFERGSDGREVELGIVCVWEPPERLVLDWYPGTGVEHPTRVEVRFVSEGAASTRIEIRHDATAASEALFPSRAPRYEAAWSRVLDALTAATGA